MLFVADLADRRPAVALHAPHLARGKPQHHVLAFLRQQLAAVARRSRDLPAPARDQFNIVHVRAQRHVAERHAVAQLKLHLLAAHHLRAHLEALRGDHVALLAVRVHQQRDMRAPVRIVFDRRDARRDAVLVAAVVDYAVQALVPAAA